jgi:Tfp pilus assembly protein PilF
MLLIRLRTIVNLLLVCLPLSQTFAESTKDPFVTSVRDADAVCASCHRDIFTRYLRTPMANASGLATVHPIEGSFDQPSSGASYSIEIEKQSLWLIFKANGKDGFEQRQRLDYFLGSGHLGVTYMYTIRGYLLESPVAYYANLKGFDMKPGLGGSPTIAAALPMSSKCMRCHMSAVQPSDDGTINRYRGLPFLHGGITCESCHGDAQAHVRSGGKSSVINPMKLDAERRDSICISCHLEGDTSVEHRGRSITDYKPGDRIQDYVTYFAYRGADFTNRGVSEVEELEASKCKRASGTHMSCMNCHDPHGGPSPEERVSFYRGKCLTCHSDAKFAATHHPETPDCTSCHMPAGKAQNIPHVAWIDHRIHIPSNQIALTSPDAPQRPALSPLLGEDSSPRDQALAYYNMVASGNLRERDRATQAIYALHEADAEDTQVLVAHGFLAQLEGERAAALDSYRAALRADPGNLFAANNLGTLLALEGQLSTASDIWSNAFRLNEDVESLGLNLALADCKLGDRDKAKEVLGTVLLYSPGSATARRKLHAIESSQEVCAHP